MNKTKFKEFLVTTITEFHQPLEIAYQQIVQYLEQEAGDKQMEPKDWRFIYTTVLPLVDLMAKHAWPERAE